MIRSVVLEIGPLAQRVLSDTHGELIAVFGSTVYMNGGGSLCCLGLQTLVNGPVNIRTGLSNLSALSVGDRWTYQDNLLTLGQFYYCDSSKASLWNAPQKKGLSTTAAFADSVKIIESALLAETSIRNTVPGVTHSLTRQRLDSYQLLLANSLLSLGTTEPYVVPVELSGLMGCGDGLTPAGDDILLGVLIAAIHFDLHHLSAPLIHWLKQTAEISTSHISYTHLMAACEGQAVEHLHVLLNTLTRVVNKSSVVAEGALNKRLEQAISNLMNHGHSSGYYTLSGVLLVLKYLAGSTPETR